ncbi:zf-TFIIB domain-containing protein [Kaistella sp.]|uniref:TFIIB-type zinc ribbon-containing protein n=1 Tax=Kaistella sp. TaxID=2782235 RepID=UPI00359FD8D2
MKCPNCNVALTMADRNGIEIDYCPDCRGVWLDRGELDKIIERSVQQPPVQQPPVPQRSSYPNQERYYSDKDKYYSDKDRYYKKKKGLLGDLFDF